MQLKHIIRPVALFAAGTLASGANATVVDIKATDAGTAINLFGSQTAQLTFDYDAGAGFTGNNKYYLKSTSGNNVTTSAGVPNASSSYQSQVSLLFSEPFSPTPTRVYTDFGTAGIRVIDDLGVTRYGRVTASAATASITDITIDGVADPFAAIAAVPEPATWATMILGLGMTGAALRRRRRVAASQPALLAA